MLAGCDQNSGSEQATDEIVSATQDVFAMDTYMTVTAYGEAAEEAVSAAITEIERLNALLTATDNTGEVYAVNQNGGGTLSEDGMYLLERSLEFYGSTEGAFNVAIFPIMAAWGFIDDHFGVPTEEELNGALELIDIGNISVDEEASSVTLKKEGMAIDFGGIAKGYTSSNVIRILETYGIENAVVNLGGNVQVLGTKPDGSFWRVGIINPFNPDTGIGVVEVADCAVITSGGYERYFVQDGVNYHHIIDPSTGYPANNGLVSVTIVSSDGTLADALSTSLFVMGVDNAISFLEKNSELFDAILITEDGEISVTEGLAENFTCEQSFSIIKTP